MAFQLKLNFQCLKRPLLIPILEPHLGTRFAQEQQDEPKRTIRSFKDLKTAFSKPLKNIWFLHVFGSRGIPREPQEAQEDSQEATKELQNPQKKDRKLDPTKLTNFGPILGFKMGLKSIPHFIPRRTKKLNQSKLVKIWHFSLNSIFNVLRGHF